VTTKFMWKLAASGERTTVCQSSLARTSTSASYQLRSTAIESGRCTQADSRSVIGGREFVGGVAFFLQDLDAKRVYPVYRIVECVSLEVDAAEGMVGEAEGRDLAIEDESRQPVEHVVSIRRWAGPAGRSWSCGWTRCRRHSRQAKKRPFVHFLVNLSSSYFEDFKNVNVLLRGIDLLGRLVFEVVEPLGDMVNSDLVFSATHTTRACSG